MRWHMATPTPRTSCAPPRPTRSSRSTGSFAGLCAVGFDAGQLVAGHAGSGDLDPSQLADTLTAVIDAYTVGVHDKDAAVPAEAIRVGAVGTLLIRSAFTALPLEDLTDTAASTLFERRAHYARLLADLSSTL